MLLKCLQAPSPGIYGEFRQRRDLNGCMPGELLSIPCSECEGAGIGSGTGASAPTRCECHRVFVGLETGRPCTMVSVSLGSTELVDHQLRMSRTEGVNEAREADTDDGVLLPGTESLIERLEPFPPGSLVRVSRTGRQVRISAATS